MATAIAEIDIGVNLIDNYLYLMDSPVTQDPDGRFLVVQNPAVLQSGSGQASELLTVDGDGQLVHYIPDTNSNSGWSKIVVPDCTPPDYGQRDSATSSTIIRLAGYYDQGGILNVLAYFPTSQGNEPSCATWMQRATDGTWSNATAILSNNAKNALACTYQTDVYVDGNGRGYFYGVSALIGDGGFFIATYDAGADKIDLIYSYDLDDFPPSPGLSEQAAFRMAAGSGGSDVTILWVDTPRGSSNTEIYYQGATITFGHLNTTFAWSNGNTLDPQVLKPGLGVFGVSDLIALPGSYGADAIILRDAAEVLYVVSGYNTASPAITPLTGGAEQPAGAVAATVGQDSNGVLTVFAIETGSTNLWYLQQQEAGGSFGTWVNLAGTLTTIASPATMTFGPELFAVDLSCDIYHQARTLADQVWVTRKVAEPSPSSPDNDQPQNIAGYNMEITALDDTGAPIPLAIVYVAADHPATIVVNCLSYHTDTNTLVPVQTDPNGQATVTYQAVDLKPPQFTMSSNADGSGVTRWCQSDVVQTDDPPPTPPATSVSAQLTSATTETLTSNGLIDPSYSDPSQAVQAINAAGPWMNPNTAAAGAVDTSRITVPHWSLDFTAPEGPRFRILSEAEAEVMRENALGSSGLLGDACHFFKNAWHELQSFSASLVGDVLTVILNGEKWTIQTLKQAGDALETVFTRIMQGLKDLYQLLKDVLDWLKMLFEWSDILNTHNVLREATNSIFQNIQSSMSGAEAEFQAWFQTLKGTVKDAFSQLGVFEQTTFNEFVNAASQGQAAPPVLTASGNVLDGDTQKQTYKQHSARCNFAHRQALSSYGNNSVTTTGGPQLGATTVTMDSIVTAFNKDINQDTFSTLSKDLQSFFENPAAFFDNGITTFCEDGAEDLVNYVIDAADDIVEAAIQDMETAVEAYLSLINATIHVPILSWIYKYEITGSIADPGDDLTALDLICLVNAIPATILCKVVAGHAPFTSSSAGVIKQYGMPWPSAPFLNADGVSTGQGLGGEMPTEMAEVLYWLQLVGVFVQLIGGALCDGIGDAFAVNEMEEVEKSPEAKWVSGINVVSSILLYGIGAPWPQFYKTTSELTITDKAILSSWAWNAVPLVVNVVCLASEQVEVKFQQGYGPILASCLSVVSEGLGIWAAVEMATHESEGYNDYEVAAAVTSNISGCCKFFILGGDDMLYVLLPVDFFTAVANLILSVFAWSEETQPS